MNTHNNKQTEAIRDLQERLEFSSDVIIEKLIEYNILVICQYNRQDICIENKMWGPSKGALKDKSTAKKWIDKTVW